MPVPFPADVTVSLIALFAALRSVVRSRLELQAEILALRHQLAVLQRRAPRRPRLYRTDRLLWVLLSRLWPNWRRAVQIVTPDTVPRATQPPASGAVVQVPHLGGLHHHDGRRAA